MLKDRHMIKRMTIILFLIGFCGVAMAQIEERDRVKLENRDLPNREGLKIGYGEAVVHGAFKVSEELESNVFLAHNKEDFDAITILGPSAGIDVPIGDSRISADYNADIFLYGKFGTENHIDHKARAVAEINLTDYKITVKDVFRDYTDRAADENSRRVGRQVNNFSAGLSAEFRKLAFDVGYTNLIETYSQKDDIIFQSITYGDRDRMSNIADGVISYRIMPKTSIFAEANLGLIHYYDSSLPPDSYFIDALVGIKGKPTNKIVVNLKGGLRFQRYDHSNIMNDKDYIGLIASGGFDYLMTKDDLVSFGVEKRPYESTYQNNNYYDVGMVSLKYTHKFSRKLSVSPFGYYQLSLYPADSTEGGSTGKRYDNFFGGGCSLKYDIRKWASTELKYEYTQKDSKFSNYDYIDNRVIFSGAVGF